MQARGRLSRDLRGSGFTCLWLVGNGGMVVIVVISLYPIPPFPTNQR